MKLRLARRAAQDLLEISDYLSVRNPEAARRIRDAIFATLQNLTMFPKAGRIQNVEGIRKVVILNPVHWFAVIPGRERSSRTRNPDTGSMFASGFRVRAFGAPRNDRTDYPDSV